MTTKISKYLDKKLSEIIIDSKELPDNIFHKKFTRYEFFDADLNSSDPLVCVIQETIKLCFEEKPCAKIFSWSDRNLLGYLHENEKWEDKVFDFSKKIRGDGDCNGLIILGENGDWVVYQSRPVDVGVFAFNSSRNLTSVLPLIEDGFFNCKDISGWLSKKSQHDIQMVNSFGNDYLKNLVKNYC